MVKKIFFNAGSQVVGKVITASVTFLITILIGRSLGREGFGEFTKIFVFVGYFYTLGDFGLNTIYIKLSHTDKNQNSVLLRSLMGLRFIMGIVLILAAIIIANILPYNAQSTTGFSPLVKMGIAIASFTILTQALFTTANAYFQKILRYDLSTIASISSAVAVLIASIFVFLHGGSVLAFTATYVLGGLALVTVAYYLLFNKTKEVITPVFKRDIWEKILKLSWPVGLALVTNLVYFRIDVLILTYVRSTAEVGLYGLSYQFFEAALTIPIFFANALYPYLTGTHGESIAEFKKQVMFWTKVLLFVSILEAFALFVVAYFIPLIYGIPFTGSIKALQILALGLPFFFISALLWHLVIIYNKQKTLLYVYGAGALFNLVTNLIFIPSFGYTAAASTTVISEALVMFLLLWVVKKSTSSAIPSLS